MVPDVPSEVLTPGEDHAALAITSTLKRFCGGWSIPFINDDDGGGGGGHVVRGEIRGRCHG